jgi:hypothetical protein
MKNLAKNLAPAAALIFFVCCLTGILTFLTVVLTSFGVGGDAPFIYFERLSLPAISIGLPILGMVLFGMTLFGLREQEGSVVESTAGETAQQQAAVVNQEPPRLKAA